MSKIKLNNLLQHKKPGDTWQSIIAPEEYKYWTKKNKWSASKFRQMGINLASVRIAGGDTEEPSTVRFNTREPLYLECGVEIRRGYMTTSAKKLAGFTLRIDSVTELNDALTELSNLYDIDQWEIKQIELYNSDEGASVLFTLHNPDGNGSNLSLWSVVIGKKEILYPELSYFEQQRYCKEFQYNFAHCVACEQKILTHGCGIEKKKKAKVVRRKKKAKVVRRKKK